MGGQHTEADTLLRSAPKPRCIHNSLGKGARERAGHEEETWHKKEALRQEVGRRKSSRVMEKNCCKKIGWCIIKNSPHLLGPRKEVWALGTNWSELCDTFSLTRKILFLTPAGDQMVPWRMKMNSPCHDDRHAGSFHCYQNYIRCKQVTFKNIYIKNNL